MNLLHIFDDLYASEINVAIETFWDAGYKIRLGDQLNGYDETGYAENMECVSLWLRDAAVRHYPDSDFAKKYINKTKDSLNHEDLRSL